MTPPTQSDPVRFWMDAYMKTKGIVLTGHSSDLVGGGMPPPYRATADCGISAFNCTP